VAGGVVWAYDCGIGGNKRNFFLFFEIYLIFFNFYDFQNLLLGLKNGKILYFLKKGII